MSGSIANMSEEQLRRIVREECTHVMTGALLQVGIDTSTPEAKAALYADFVHVRRWRSAFDGLSLLIGRTIVTGVVLGALSLAAWLFKTHIIKS